MGGCGVEGGCIECVEVGGGGRVGGESVWGWWRWVRGGGQGGCFVVGSRVRRILTDTLSLLQSRVA